MMTTKNLSKTMLAALLTAGMTTAATADSVTAEFDGFALGGLGFTYSLDGSSPINTSAGMFRWTDTQTNETYETFCIELKQYLRYDAITYDLVDASTAPYPGRDVNSDGIPDNNDSGENGAMGVDRALLLNNLFYLYRDSVVDTTTSAAFQLAVWEVVFDEGVSLSDDSFQIAARSQTNTQQNNAVSLAQEWLNSLNVEGGQANIVAWSNKRWQDQVTTTVVPTPTAIGGSLAMLALLGAGARRRRQSA